jgi:protein-tyrosine-phosphatase
VSLFGRGDDGSEDDPLRVLFMCVENAGRSQMAAALAERECERRGIDDEVEVRSAGTHPADSVHPVVVEAMAEVGIDLSDRVPTLVEVDRLDDMDHIATMGCYVAEFNPGSFGGETHEWDVTNPEGQDLATARAVREDLADRVGELFDRIEREVTAGD